MVNFEDELTQWKIENDNGQLIEIRKLPKRSITSEKMADELLSVIHYTPRYMASLDNKMLLTQFMKHITLLSENCVSKSRKSKTWDCTYNSSVIYWLDNFVNRYKEMFTSYGLETFYTSKPLIEALYVKASENYNILVNDKKLNDLSLIRLCNETDEIRANTAGFNALILHYSDTQFLKELKYHIDNCHYSSEATNFWFIIEEIINRIRTGELETQSISLGAKAEKMD